MKLQLATAEVESVPVELDDLYTIQELARLYPGKLSIPTLRWQMRHRKENGLDRCSVKLGRRVLISKSRYERLFLTQRIGA